MSFIGRKVWREKMRGFLMNEAIISLFVLSVGLLAILALISSSTRQSFDSRDTIIATGLAQEGIELIRNVRDNGFIVNVGNPTGNPFINFPSSINDRKHCYIKYTDATPTCTSSFLVANYILSYAASGFYTHGSGSTTKFSRYIYLFYNNQAWTVRSFVWWGAAPPASVAAGAGDPTDCTVTRKCVFTEITLTNWSQ